MNVLGGITVGAGHEVDVHVWHAGHVQAGHGVGMIPSFSARVLRMNSKHSYKLLKKFDILATDVDSTK